MKEYTSEEVTKIIGLSQREIQEYLYYGNVDLGIKPSKKNKYGHLLYGEKEIERLWLLRFFRELNCTKKEIENILTDPNFDYCYVIDEQIKKLEEKKEGLEKLIHRAKTLKESHMHPTFPLTLMKDSGTILPFNYFFQSIDVFSDIINYTNQQWEQLLPSKDAYTCRNSFCEIMHLIDEGKEYTNSEIQAQIIRIYNILKKISGDSLTFFKITIKCLYTPGNELYQILEKEYGENKLILLRKSIDYFCTWTDVIIKNKMFSEIKNNNVLPHNTVDLQLDQSTSKLIYLYNHKYAPNSPEVQMTIKNLMNALKEVKLLPPTSSLIQFTLLPFKDDIETRKKKKNMSNSEKEEIKKLEIMYSFILDSMQIYCANNRTDIDK